MFNQKQKNNLVLSIPLAVTVFLGSSFFALPVSASDCKVACDEKCAYITDSDLNQNCQNQCKSDEQKCETLNNQAATYNKLLKINNQTQNLLSDQLDSINQQQVQTQQTLKTVQQKMDTTADQIDSLKSDINEKEKEIEYQKKILSNLMQTYYDYDQQGVLELVLWNREMSTSFGQSDYIEQSGLKVSDVLAQIQNTQTQLLDSRQKLQEDYQANAELSDQFSQKKEDLQSSENQKQYLLEKTQGEEAKYQQMLANIEKQKAELFDFSSASNIGDVLDSVKDYPQPDKKYWASTSWYFSQTDSRWGNQKIGNSRSLMRDYGCAVTSVAMVLKNLGASISPSSLAKAKVFSGDLINWPGSWNPDIELVSSVGHGNVNWTTIKSQISDDHPVIVHIKKATGGGGHYVVITGRDSKDYIVHDPYFGANLYLGTSMSLIGKLGTNSRTSIDQMIIYN
ncbi:MAG: C39 family peptidase [Parcubacteria group bacterium]